MIKNLNEILKEWAYRVDNGQPNPKNSAHLYHLSEILIEYKWPFEVIEELLQNLNEQDSEREKVMKKVIKYKNKDGEDKEISVGGALKQGEEHPAYKQAKQMTDTGDKPKGDKVDEPSDFERGTDQNKGVDPDYTRDKKPKKKKSDYEPDFDSSPEEIANKLGGGEFKETNNENAVKQISSNRQNIFDNKVSGKGGGETSVQEEIASISREMAQQYPNDSQEEHEARVSKYVTDNYGDTKFGSNEKTMNKLIKKSCSGLSVMKKIKNNKNQKYAEEQPKGFPLNLTYTQDGTQTVQNLLITKLKNAETEEEKEHYKNQLRKFQEMATSSTGVEGDGDTAVVFMDDDGRLRVVHSSNKQTLSDQFSNATVLSAARAVNDSVVGDAEPNAINDVIESSVEDAVEFNKTYTKGVRNIIDENEEHFDNINPLLTKISAGGLTGKAEFDKGSPKYLKNARKSKAVIKYIEDNGLDINNDEHVVKAAMKVAGTDGADGVSDAMVNSHNKMILKISKTTAGVRDKLQKLIDSGKSVEEAAEILSKRTVKGKPLFGGVLSTDEMIKIYNDKNLKKLEDESKTRGQSLQDAHDSSVTSLVELDINSYIEQGMSEEEARKKYENEAGEHERTYTRSFMKRMHFDKYINGDVDDDKVIEIGNIALTPKDFRECLGTLTEWDGEGDLMSHVEKTMRIKPGTQSLMFVNSKGEEQELAEDTWRTAGDQPKIAGRLNKDLRKCLAGKA